MDAAHGSFASGIIMNKQYLQAENTESFAVRDQADALLAKLIKDRAMCEQRLAEKGQADPIKVVTGRSAIDKAIAETRAVIDNVDKMHSNSSEPAPEITIHVFDKLHRATQPV